MMAESFGEQLRLAREERGISLREISDETRIATRYLEAIEQNNYKNLPGGIFNKSFVRAYAKQVGFDEKEALAGYVRTSLEMGSDPDDAHLVPHKPMEQYGQSRSPLVTLLLTFLILGILSLAAYGILHWYQRSESAGPVTPPAGNKPPAPAPSPGVQNAPVALQPQPTAPADGTLAVQVKAPSEDVWFRAIVDDDPPAQLTLKAGTTQDYAPKQKLRIEMAKVKAGSIEISVNGQLVKLTPDMTGKMAVFAIDKASLPQAL